VLRAVSPGIFEADPLRLLRAVRLEDELGLRLDPETERLVLEGAALVVRPAGERIVSELLRLSADGYRRAGELGLLAPLGGSVESIDRGVDAETRFVAAFGERVPSFPVPNELRRLASVLLRAEAPPDDSPRSIHRFRRATEPWALEALAWLGAGELRGAVERARASDPAEPLVRGDELGLPPGPAIGRALEAIAEERAAGTISTREQALALARSLAGEA
jgi:tRNA nucleotidyltransferase/poly(A) polymerase